MATNGILDITTEDYMGQDPEMQIDQDEMLDIINTLQVIGVPQDKHPEILEAFKEWKQTKNGTIDMFLEESFQLEPGTITKIKTEKQVAQGPQDMPSEDDMNIPPGSDDMLEIMQSVGAPQRAAGGGRIGYQGGEQVLPMPRPTEEDSRLDFFRQMGAMPEQTLLKDPSSQRMNAMSGHMGGQGIMGATPDPFGGLLGGEEGDIGQGGQPLVEYEHEGAEEPQSWWDKMRTGTHDAGVAHTPDIDMEMIIDFLKKMGMAINKENIAKAAKALGMAMKFGGVGGAAGLGLQGLGSLGAPEEIEETETEQMFQDGGAVPRQGFFLGKVAKAITGGAKKVLKSAKKVLKSDLGKMAMLYLATAGASNYMAGAPKGWNWKNWVTPKSVGENIGSVFGKTVGEQSARLGANQYSPFVEAGYNKNLSTVGKNIINKDPTSFLSKAWDFAKKPGTFIPAAMLAGGAYTAATPGDIQFDTDKRDEEVNKWTQWLAQVPPADDIVYPYPNYGAAQGGRVGRQEGGIMDLGGGEKDYRNTGGFVDIGAKEKADDVPARLSVNEFVMTADAVRGAGDGDVEEGAERLQDTMKQLEQKGKRHKAAQGMFATSQRLGEVI